MDREIVKVIVPIYTARLTGYEEQSFRHNLRLLGRYPISLLAPEGLDTQWYEQVAAGVEIRRVSEEWLGRQGIDGRLQVYSYLSDRCVDIPRRAGAVVQRGLRLCGRAVAQAQDLRSAHSEAVAMAQAQAMRHLATDNSSAGIQQGRERRALAKARGGIHRGVRRVCRPHRRVQAPQRNALQRRLVLEYYTRADDLPHARGGAAILVRYTARDVLPTGTP